VPERGGGTRRNLFPRPGGKEGEPDAGSEIGRKRMKKKGKVRNKQGPGGWDLGTLGGDWLPVGQTEEGKGGAKWKKLAQANQKSSCFRCIAGKVSRKKESGKSKG